MNKIKDLSIKFKIILGFSILIVMMIFISLYSIFKIHDLTKITSDFYKYPYQLSNTTKAISFRITLAISSVKDIALTKSKDEQNAALNRISKMDEEILILFKNLEESSFSYKNKINEAKKQFETWIPLRTEVVNAMIDGNMELAGKIIKEKAMPHDVILYKQMEELTKSAEQNGKDFYNNSQEIKNEILQMIITIFIVTILVSILITYIIFVDIKFSLKVFQEGLLNFFSYLSNETQIIELMSENKNEFGQMSKIINKNIKRIEQGILKDKETVENVLEVVESINKGYLNVWVTKEPNNLQLNSLCKAFNKMIDELLLH